MFNATCTTPFTIAASLLALAAFTAPAPSQSLPKQGSLHPELAPLDQAMEQVMTDNGITAGLLGVMRNGEIIMQRAYGWSDDEMTEPLHPEAIMRVASVSKPITAAAIHRLVASGLLSLDDFAFDFGQGNPGILDIAPFNSDADTPVDPRLANIEIQHLLRHEGGWDRDSCVLFDGVATYSVVDCSVNGAIDLPDLTRREVVIASEMGVASPPSRADTARWILGQNLSTDGRGLVLDPGADYRYSNEGYFFLGMIVEAVSGMDYLDYVRQHVFAPIFRDGCELELGRTFAIDQGIREPYYDSGGAMSTNVYDPGGRAVEAAYGGWNHEARRGQGNMVIGTAPLLHLLENYQVNGADIGIVLPSGPTALRRHGGNLSGTNAMARQRDDGINYAIIFNKNGNDVTSGDAYATTLLDAIDALIDGGTITWPAGDVETDCNGNGVPDGCDVADFASLDLNGNLVPDECEVIVNITQQTFHPTIQDAVNLSTWGDVIMVPPGTYTAGFAISTHSVTVKSTAGPEVTIIDRAFAGGSVIEIEDVFATIEGFTITGGLAERGAGLRVTNASPIIRDCIFEGNVANGTSGLTGGGGIFLEDSHATIESCVFDQNTTGAAQNGGAIHGSSAIPTIMGCTFTANEAAAGGAITLSHGAPEVAVIMDCTFTNNHATAYDGGALRTYNIGFDVQDCSFAGNTARNGGAVFHDTVNNSTTRYMRCDFDGNVAGVNGGGVWTNCGASALIELDECTFTENSCGAGLLAGANGGAANIGNAAVLTDCVFEGNHSSVWAGAARIQSGSIEIVRCSFVENTADKDHGALYIGTAGASIRDSIFRSNSAVQDTGALYAPSSEVIRCVFEDNTSGRWAGALYAGDLVDSCVFTGNSAESGGAVFNLTFASDVRNCLFAGNSADVGGAYWGRNGGEHTIVNSTFVANQAVSGGGGLYTVSGEITLHNSIVWGNSADAGGAGLSDVGTFIVAFSDVQGGVRPGPGNRSSDPLFIDAAGGNYRLGVNSPAIDAGDDGLVPVELTLDLDGADRFQDADGNGSATVDLGAYEASEANDADVSGDGVVGFDDLLIVISAWGPCPPRPAECGADIDGDGEVGFGDLLIVISAWD